MSELLLFVMGFITGLFLGFAWGSYDMENKLITNKARYECVLDGGEWRVHDSVKDTYQCWKPVSNG